MYKQAESKKDYEIDHKGRLSSSLKLKPFDTMLRKEVPSKEKIWAEIKDAIKSYTLSKYEHLFYNPGNGKEFMIVRTIPVDKKSDKKTVEDTDKKTYTKSEIDEFLSVRDKVKEVLKKYGILIE